jgi:hypothetical protein
MVWLDLGELAPAEGRRFVEAYLDTQPNRLGSAFRAALFNRTGGHALFTVELVRELQERGDLHQDETGQWIDGPAIDWNTLPARVEGAIEKRIQRLETALRSILTIASVEGETFTAEVVARVQQVQERALVQRLSQEPTNSIGSLRRRSWTGSGRSACRSIASGISCSSSMYITAWPRWSERICTRRSAASWKRSTASKPNKWQCSWRATSSRPG